MGVITTVYLRQGLIIGPIPPALSLTDPVLLIGHRTSDLLQDVHTVKLDVPAHSLGAPSLAVWVPHVQAARCPQEQNVEMSTDRQGSLYLRVVRDVPDNSELLAWFSEELALNLGLPQISSQNITGDGRYQCSHCSELFKYPYSLRAHARFRCKQLGQQPQASSSQLGQQPQASSSQLGQQPQASSSQLGQQPQASSSQLGQQSQASSPQLGQQSSQQSSFLQVLAARTPSCSQQSPTAASSPGSSASQCVDSCDELKVTRAAVKRGHVNDFSHHSNHTDDDDDDGDDNDDDDVDIMSEPSPKRASLTCTELSATSVCNVSVSSSLTSSSALLSSHQVEEKENRGQCGGEREGAEDLSRSAFQRVTSSTDAVTSLNEVSHRLLEGLDAPHPLLSRTPLGLAVPPLTDTPPYQHRLQQNKSFKPSHSHKSGPAQDRVESVTYSSGASLPRFMGAPVVGLGGIDQVMQASLAAAAAVRSALHASPSQALYHPGLLPPRGLQSGLATLNLSQNWCAKCNMSFRMTSDLVYHMRSHHKREFDPVKKRKDDKLKCDVCGETFRERHHLTRHMTSHT